MHFLQPALKETSLAVVIGQLQRFRVALGRVGFHAVLVDDGFVRLSISDNGGGMSLSDIETAMRPFGQVDAGFNKRHEGTGLGLPISAALAKLHGGNLIIDSEKGKGTRVTVFLPIYDPIHHHDARKRH